LDNNATNLRRKGTRLYVIINQNLRLSQPGFLVTIYLMGTLNS